MDNNLNFDMFLLSDCNINYHHNYQVLGGQRFYYDSLPDIIQVGEHQFAERKLINLWISMMLLSWTSATNCARIYNMSMTDDTVPNWQFNLSVTSDQVYDGFTILSLLEDCLTQQKTLVVPHGGESRDRFTEAVRVRNNRLRLSSQPEVFHHCEKCTRTYNSEEFSRNEMKITSDISVDPWRKVSVIVIDGVCVSHPCCGIVNCKTPLENNQHRFCPEHSHSNTICSIVSCSNPVILGRKSCALVDHQRVENVHNQRGQSRFQLKERLERSQLAHPNDAIGEQVTSISEIIDDDDEQLFETTREGPVPLTANLAARSLNPRIRAQFGRRRTHNEQLFVAPCGMIIARETFYHAEALYSVIVSMTPFFYC